MRIYTKKERKKKTKYHKKYNHKHDYSTDEKRGRQFTGSEMYLIIHKRLKGGRVLTDPQIAKLLKRSLQSVQLKRHKLRKEGF